MSGTGLVFFEEWRPTGQTPDPPRHVRLEPTMPEIVAAAADAFGVSVDELVGRPRTQPLQSYRQATIAACRQLTGSSYPIIGRLFGRDHHTVISAVTRVAGDDHLSSLTRRLVDVVRDGLQ